jgi:multiple sugar transport system substrate-binding protein
MTAMTLRKKIAAGALVLATVASLTACSSGGSGSSSDGKGTLSMWVPEPNPQPGIFQAATKRFTAKTGIKVNIDQYPWSTYETKLTTALTSGTGPDVAEIGNTWAAGLQNTGGLTDWTSADYKAIGGKSQFVSSALGVTGAPGKSAASVPVAAQTWVLLYNKSMLKNAGIAAPPKTWTEMIADAKKLTDPAKGVYGIATAAAGGQQAAQTLVWVMAKQWGGNVVTKDGKATMESAPVVDAVTNFVNWAGSDGIMSPDVATDAGGTKADAALANGTAAMELTQNVSPVITKPGQIGLADVPLEEANATGGRAIMSHVAGENLAIFKNTKLKSEALKLVKFLSSESEQVTINKALYEIPTTTAAAQNPYFQTSDMKTYTSILQDHAQPSPTGKNAYVTLNAYGAAIVNLVKQAVTSHSVTRAQVQAAMVKADATADATGGQ